MLESIPVGTAAGNVSQEAHDDYNTAITSAIAVRDDASATQAEVDAAVTALATSVTTFNYAIIPFGKIIALLVSDPITEGFKVKLTPARNGLEESNFILLDSSNNRVTIIDATTLDSGATFAISTTLIAGQTYTVTAIDIGYQFGAAQSVVVPAGTTINAVSIRNLTGGSITASPPQQNLGQPSTSPKYCS